MSENKIKKIDQVMDVKILKQILAGNDESKIHINYMPIGTMVVEGERTAELSEIPTEILIMEVLDRLPNEHKLNSIRELAKHVAIVKMGSKEKAAKFLGLKSKRSMYIKR